MEETGGGKRRVGVLVFVCLFLPFFLYSLVSFSFNPSFISFIHSSFMKTMHSNTVLHSQSVGPFLLWIPPPPNTRIRFVMDPHTRTRS